MIYSSRVVPVCIGNWCMPGRWELLFVERRLPRVIGLSRSLLLLPACSSSSSAGVLPVSACWRYDPLFVLLILIRKHLTAATI